MRVLAGDIGGTKTLLALAEVHTENEGGRVTLEHARRYDSRRFAGLVELCQQYVREEGVKLPERAAFGVAGPVLNGTSKVTNLPWQLDERALGQALGRVRVRLANDFVALACGLPALLPEQVKVLREGRADPLGNVAVIGAGTGLGEAIVVVESTGRRRVLATEGGHGTFAPRTELEMALVRSLAPRWGRVSWERLLSGDGLVCLAEALSAVVGLELPRALQEAITQGRGSAPALVTQHAEGGDVLCKRALSLFCSIYGAETGDFALRSFATGGVFVAGGIAPKILAHLQEGAFLHAFLDKGRMRSVLESIPVRVVLDAEVPLRGAALLAAELA